MELEERLAALEAKCLEESEANNQFGIALTTAIDECNAQILGIKELLNAAGFDDLAGTLQKIDVRIDGVKDEIEDKYQFLLNKIETDCN
jgi:hypothetical protein